MAKIDDPTTPEDESVEPEATQEASGGIISTDPSTSFETPSDEPGSPSTTEPTSATSSTDEPPVAEAPAEPDAVDSTESTSPSSETPSTDADAAAESASAPDVPESDAAYAEPVPDEDDQLSANPELSAPEDSVDAKGEDEDADTIGHVQDAAPEVAPALEETQQTAAAGYGGVTTGISGDAFPNENELVISEETVTVESPVSGEEYEQPKFYARYDSRGVHIAPYGWVGEENLFIARDDLDDFKSFAASL